MKLEIFKSSYGYYNLRTIEGRPTEEMVNYLKGNGYRWSKNNNCWYPATTEAKEANLHNDFVADFEKRFFDTGVSPETKKNDIVEKLVDDATDFQLDNDKIKSVAQGIKDSVVSEKIVKLEELIAELQEAHRRDLEKIERLENELANSHNVEALADLYTMQEQQELDEEAEWEREFALTEDEEQAIIEETRDEKPEKENNQENDDTIIINTSELLDAVDRLAREEEPAAERDFLAAKKEPYTSEELAVTMEELSIVKSILPTAQYVTTLRLSQGEEGDFFKQKIKDIAASVLQAPKIGNTHGLDEHPLAVRYFHPSGTETLICEIGKDGEAFGFQCLNGDYDFAEWGYIDLDELKNIRGMEVDFHVPEGMTIERWLYKEHPDMFPEYAKFVEQEEEEEVLIEAENGQMMTSDELRTWNEEQEMQHSQDSDFNELSEGKLFALEAAKENEPKYSFFVKDTAEFEQFADFEPITNLSAKEAVETMFEQEMKDLSAGIGIHIPGDFIFDDPNGQGAIVFNKVDDTYSFYMGDNFVKELKANDEHAKNVIAAFKELDEVVKEYHLNGDHYKEPDFLYEKEKELFAEDLEKSSQEENAPAESPFDRVTKQYSEKYKDFFDTYAQMKEKFLENESRYIGDARIRSSFEQIHDELVKLQIQEVNDIIKESANLEEAKENAVRYFNFNGNDGLTTNNLYFATKIGSYNQGIFSTSSEKLHEYIENKFNETHNIENPKYDFTQPVNISDRFAIDFVKRDDERETIVRFIDRKYNQITTGSYYISTMLEHKKGVGLTLDGGVPEWSVDAEVTAKAIEICEYYKNNNITVTSQFVEGHEDIETQKKNYILNKLLAAGIEVVTDKDEYNETLEIIEELNITLEMLNEKPNYLQKISSEINSELNVGQDTTRAISTPNNQNHIIFISGSQEIYFNRLDELNYSNNSPEEFYHNLRKVFDIDEPTKRSGYVCQKIDEDYYKLRISNHSVKIRNRTGAKTKQTSIVIKLANDERRTNEKARVIEYIYNPDNLTAEKMNGIISGIKDWMKTGEYTDKNFDEQFISHAEMINGKFEIIQNSNVQKMVSSEYYNKEVDAFVTDKSGFVDPEKIAAIDLYGFEKAKEMWKDGEPDWNTRMMLQDKSISDYLNWRKSNIYNYKLNNEIYGFAYEGKIYLNPEIWNSEVAVHEYTHLWDNYIQRTNPELWEKGKQIFINTRYWNEVKNDPNYADIADNNDLILSEVHSRLCGELAEKVLNKILEQEGKITADKVINWNNETWEYVLKDLGVTNFPVTQTGKFGFDEIRDFLAAPLKDLMNGKRITQEIEKDNSPKPDNPQHTPPIETNLNSDEEIKNAARKLETIIKQTYLTVPEDEANVTFEQLQKRYDKWTRPMAREILEELKKNNQNIIKTINDFDMNVESHKKEGSYGTARELFNRDVQYELMPALYKEVQNKIIEKYNNDKTPYVVLNWSESPVFPIENKVYTLKEFNELLTQADKEFHNRKEYAEKKYGSADNYWELRDAGKLPEEDNDIQFGYDKTDFKIFNIPNPENPEDTITYDGNRYDIGDGEGSVFDFVRSTCSYDNIIESMNKLETELYFPGVTEEQKAFVEKTVKEEAVALKQALSFQMEVLDIAQNEYTELHKKWLIESSEAERVEEKLNFSLEGFKSAYDNSIANIYTKFLNEYPFASGNVADSELLKFTANEAKKLMISELYRPSREYQKAMNNGDSQQYTRMDWEKFRKIWNQFPAKVNMTEYVEKLLQDKCEEKGYSVYENNSVNKEVEQLTSKKDIKAIREQCRKILEKLDNSYLTEKEMAYLENELGEKNEADRKQVEASLRSIKYIYTEVHDGNYNFDLDKGKIITADEARKMLPMSDFVAAVDRASFHYTTGRVVYGEKESIKGYIHFDDSDRDRVVPPYELTQEDLSILAQYEGAGGLNEENRTNSGILNEFYTPNNLIEKVWQVVDSYAPNAISVLEPSAGVGKFANNRPNNIFTMHELDGTSARINKILHPEANVIQGAYQKQFFDEGERFRNIAYEQPKYDVVIGNPPYGAYNDKYKGLGEGKEFDRYEEYFISKGLDALKDENSVMAFVVPSGFLNTASDKQKEIIASKGKLIDAYRLPVGTFPTTEVGTDIIILQNWEKERKELENHWNSQGHFLTVDEAIKAEQKGHIELLSNGEWFKQHPEKILGELRIRSNRFGKEEEYVAVHEGLTVQDELNKIDGILPLIKPELKTNQSNSVYDKMDEIQNETNENYKKELVSNFQDLVKHLAYDDSDEQLDFLFDRKNPEEPTVADIFNTYLSKYMNGEKLVNLDVSEENPDIKNVRELFLHLQDIKGILEIDDRYGSAAGFLEDRQYPLEYFQNEDDYYAQPIAADIIANVLNDFEKKIHIEETLEWLVNTHKCDVEPTEKVLTKLYDKFSISEAFERSKLLPIAFGNTSYEKMTLPRLAEREANGELALDRTDDKNPGVQWKVTEEELDTVFGIYNESLDYHTVLDRDWAAINGLPKEQVANILEWDYGTEHNHKLVIDENQKQKKEKIEEVQLKSAESAKKTEQQFSVEQPVKTKSPRPKKDKWNIQKSKGEVMSAEEFSHLYGRDFDEREFPIWAATDWQGNIDLEKLTFDDLRYMKDSGNYIQKNVGEWTHKVLFTSGDIYSKIEEQKKLRNEEIARNGENSEMAKDFAKNIELLEASKKASIDMEHIHFGLKSTLAEDFIITHYDEDNNPVELNLQESFILWATNDSLPTQYWRGNIDFATANITREELGEDLSFYDIVQYIDGVPVKADAVRGWRTRNMTDDEKAAEKAERRKEADLKRQARADIANRLFDRYLHEGLDDVTRTRLEAEYNRRFNSYVIPDYLKLPLFVNGMSAYKGESKFKLYDQQIKGISFLCNKGNGLLAYDVGVGKTAAGIVATVNQMQTGRSKRPLIVVPNQVYAKWYTDIRQLFPNIKVNDLYNFNKDSVGKYINKDNPHALDIPMNTISLCTYEALKNITFTDDSCEYELYQDFTNLLSVDMDGSDRENAGSSDKIKGVIGAASHVNDSSYYFFEKCGFDNLTVDEAHNFKNLWVVPRPKKKGSSNEYSGIPSGKPSARALKMYGMTQLVQRNNDNRNVFMLTATPFTNSPTEVYSMLSYIGRERLQQAGISSLRSFFDQFAQTKQELGVSSRGDIDTKQVMKNWKELPALQNILTEFIDKVDGEEAGIIRPNKFTHVKPLDMSELQIKMREMDEERMAEVKDGNSAAVIVAMNNMRLACVAPALANPDMYEGLELPPLSQLVETSPKLKFVCDAIIDMYKDNPEKGQFMYVPLGKDSHGIIKDYLVQHGIPKEAVEIINGEVNNTPEKKEKITGKFNDEKDKLKIIIGGRNTSEGIDLNGNSFVMYNCSLGWNPSETIQAEGRIWRQGNQQGHVHIVYPVMNDSIDSVLYQKHDEKRSRINELWNYKGDSLNVEDINPEDLKLDLIKDPQKKAKLILQEETKESRAELSKLKLKIKTFDEMIEKRKQLTFDFGSSENEVKEYEIMIKEKYKDRNLEVPNWIQNAYKKQKKDSDKILKQKESINKKLHSMNLDSEEVEAQYIQNLNAQKRICEEKIQHITDELPEILKKLEVERLEQKVMEYPVAKQREILEADILNNLRPMKEVEYEIKTLRYESMLAEKLKAGDIAQEEYDLYKAAGYEKYEKWLNGEIESLEEQISPVPENQKIIGPQENIEVPNDKEQVPSEPQVEVKKLYQVITYSNDSGSDEKLEYATLEEAKIAAKDYLTNDLYKNEDGVRDYDGIGIFNKESKKIEYKSGHFPLSKIFDDEILKINGISTSDNLSEQINSEIDYEVKMQKAQSLADDEESLFFGVGVDDVFVHSPESFYEIDSEKASVQQVKEFYSSQQQYFNFDSDDIHLTPEQLIKAEQKRDEIIFPVLSGKETGMYKAFNDFATHGVFDVVGTKIDMNDKGLISSTGWEQLQAAMNIYRSKEFETFRYVLISKENGMINEQLSVTSYMPNRCAVSKPDSSTLKEVITCAEETDSLVAIVHNHPSGNIEQSKEDELLTKSLEESLTKISGESRFAGHIILDHGMFNLYTPNKGWQAKIDWNHYGNDDQLVNKEFKLSDLRADNTTMIFNAAQKINDVNNWNDDYVPVMFSNAGNDVTGIKLYDKSFFDKSATDIRKSMRSSGIEAGAIRAFPVITEAFKNKLSGADMIIFEDRLKNLVMENAFTDVVLPDSTVVAKYDIKPGFDIYAGLNSKINNPDIKSTWKPHINTDLFTQTDKPQGDSSDSNKNTKSKKAAGMER